MMINFCCNFHICNSSHFFDPQVLLGSVALFNKEFNKSANQELNCYVIKAAANRPNA